MAKENPYGKKIKIEEMTVEQMLLAIEHKCYCRICGNCGVDKHCFVDENRNCSQVAVDVLNRLKKEIAEKEASEKNSRPEGTCADCKYFDEDLKNRGGYCFCSAWHNFTMDDGFCHFYACKSGSQAVR